MQHNNIRKMEVSRIWTQDQLVNWAFLMSCLIIITPKRLRCYGVDTQTINIVEVEKNSSTPGVLSSWVLLRFIKCHVDNWSTSDVHQEAEKNVKRPLFPSSSPKLQKEKIKNNCRQFFFTGHKYTTHNLKNSAWRSPLDFL